MSEVNGGGAGAAFRRTDRTDAPYYLARYTERRSLQASAQAAPPVEQDADLPLYLRRFRERGNRARGQSSNRRVQHAEADG